MKIFREAATTVRDTGEAVSKSAADAMTSVLLVALAVLAVAVVVLNRAL